MLILTMRTDKPEAEIALFDGTTQVVYDSWQAHRELAETLHTRIKQLLGSQNKDWHDIAGIVCYQGPGSFTGLRIGLTVGNALAYGLQVPIVAELSDDWIDAGITRLMNGQADELALPFYGADAHITPPKK